MASLRPVSYVEKCTLGGLQGWSLNTGGLKDRFDCTKYNMNQTKAITKVVIINRELPPGTH